MIYLDCKKFMHFDHFRVLVNKFSNRSDLKISNYFTTNIKFCPQIYTNEL